MVDTKKVVARKELVRQKLIGMLRGVRRLKRGNRKGGRRVRRSR